MNGLCIHTPGSGRVTMEQAFSAPVAEKTDTYQPVPNKELWEMLVRIAETKGLKLGTPEFGLAANGQKMFGTAPITKAGSEDDEWQMMIGLRNSQNKSMSVGVCFGSKVFVCDNMCFSGYTSEDENAVGQVHHRHSINVWEGLRIRLEESMAQHDVFQSYQHSFYNHLKNIRLRDVQANDLIIQSARAGAITAKDCMTVANGWLAQGHCPENKVDASNWHKEFMPRNAWSLYNCFTEQHKAFQKKNPLEANIRSIKMNSFFHKTFMSN